MSYNFEERINRAINNHQFTCEHRSHYLFILKGFTAFLDNITINVEPLDVTKLESHTNFYITYEEAMDLSQDVIDDLNKESYDIWTVDFNLIPNTWIARDGALIVPTEYDSLSFALERKTLPVFNTNNPLVGIVADFDKEYSFDDYISLMQEIL